VHNGHPQNLKKWPFDRGALIKVRFILAVTKLYWPLLKGGHFSEVAVTSGLTVLLTPFPFLPGKERQIILRNWIRQWALLIVSSKIIEKIQSVLGNFIKLAEFEYESF
jgi:hypothetical protein